MKITSNSQLKAVKIYTGVKAARRELMKKITNLGLLDDLEKSIKKTFQENKPDRRAMEILKMLLENEELNKDDLSMDEKFLAIMDRVTNIISVSNQPTRESRIPVYLSSATGQLSRDPAEKFNFFIKPGNKNFKILETLNSEYKQTEEIKRSIKALNNPATRKMINTLNSKIKAKLKLNPPLIESRVGDGYRINNAYELIID